MLGLCSLDEKSKNEAGPAAALKNRRMPLEQEKEKLQSTLTKANNNNAAPTASSSNSNSSVLLRELLMEVELSEAKVVSSLT